MSWDTPVSWNRPPPAGAIIGRIPQGHRHSTAMAHRGKTRLERESWNQKCEREIERYGVRHGLDVVAPPAAKQAPKNEPEILTIWTADLSG